jgi:ABC-2 type transport system permease protein
MRKILVIAARDYRAAVRTKAFLITLILMPVFMFGSLVVQTIIKNQSVGKDKHFAIVDRTPGAAIFSLLQQAVEKRNQHDIYDPQTHKQTKPRFVLQAIPPSAPTLEAANEQRLELSNEVRAEKYWGFLEIGPHVTEVARGESSPVPTDASSEFERGRDIRYQTNHPTDETFPMWAQTQVPLAILKQQVGDAAVKVEDQRTLLLKRLALTERAPDGSIKDPPLIHLFARFFVPLGLVLLMFMIILLSSTPGMQAIVEEKMQRIAEVLLGSVRPFSLMLGKLLGLTGVSLTMAAVYLGGSYWAAHHYKVAEFLPVSVLAWYLVYQVLAMLMYGSLFLAIGAACTEVKETQTLAMPVMMLTFIPLFILGTALEDPNHPLVVGMSFFPPVTPMLMMARIAISPAPPLWQLLLAVGLVSAVTLLCVYTAGRIFRVGILMQGKGARFGQLVRWAVRG